MIAVYKDGIVSDITYGGDERILTSVLGDKEENRYYLYKDGRLLSAEDVVPNSPKVLEAK